MGKAKGKEKAVALFLALTAVIIVTILAGITLSLISSHSRLTHHEVSRIQAYYAAQAGINYTLEKLRTGQWPIPESDSYYVCMRGNIDSGVTCSTEYTIPIDDDIPYKIQIQIWPQGQGGEPLSNTAQIDAKVEYAYTD